MDYKCTDCDLYKDSCAGTKKQFQLNKIEGKGTIKAKIMVVGTYPGASECESGIPFTGTTGVTLKKALTSAGITEEEVYFTYLVKCRTPRTKKSGERLKERDPLKKERTACLAHFKKEVEEINPNVIIMLGNVVTDTLIQKKGITSIHGTPYWSEDFLATCIPVYSPDYIKRPYADTSDEVNFIADLKFAKESSEKNEFKAKEKQETNYIFCDTLVKVRGLIKRLKTLDEYAFDIESTGLDPRNSELLGIAFSWKEGTGVYVPFNLWFQYYDEENYEEMRKDMEQVITTYVPEGKKLKKKKDDGTVFYELEDFWDNFEYAEIMKTLVPLIVNKEIRKIGHNIAFDVGYLNLKWDVDIQNASYCTMLAEYLPDPESMASRSLEALAWKYTDMGGYDDGLKGERKVGFRNTPVEDLAMYGCGDVDATFRIYLVQGAIIEPFLDLLQNILVPLSIAIREMEYNGMKVDVDRIKTLAVEYEAKIIDHETKLLTLKDVEDFVQTYLDAQKKDIKRKWLNSETLMKNHTKKEYYAKNLKSFNYGSTIQLRELLVHLGLDTGMQTDTGLMSTNEKALMGLKGKHKMIDHLLELRHLKKIYSTYLKPIPELASFDGRIHTSFRLAKTATGRLSSSKPNLQNIPKKKDGKAIRDYFTASEGNFLIESDLRQIEYRILAHYVNDPKMIQDIREGLDIHSLTASESYDIPFEEFKRRIKAGDPEAKELRGRAKAVTFGVPYGRSSFSLAKELGMSVDEAEGFRLSLLNRYPRVFQWIEKMLEGARKHGYVKTYFGRIRYLPKINDKNQKLREAEERKVVATCIQGTASDILSTYTINIRERLRKSGAKTKMVLTVHDALFFDAPKDEVPTIVQMLKEEMERPIEGIRVPIETETMIGLRWGSLVEYDKQEKENV